MNTFRIKLIAVVCMLLDHIAYFIPDMPIFFHWIGRIAAPIFFFCIANGMKYTTSRKKYILRLYTFSVIMSVIQVFLHIELNIFRALFTLSLMICIFDFYNKDRKVFRRYFVIYILYQVIITILIFCVVNISDDSRIYDYFLPAVTGSILDMEGGVFFVALGILFYFCLDNKVRLSIAYTLFTVIYEILSGTQIIERVLSKIDRTIPVVGGYIAETVRFLFEGYTDIFPPWAGGDPFFEAYQWMMILALPFFIAYNHKSGPKVKWFFYIFYPLHIVVLYYIGLGYA